MVQKLSTSQKIFVQKITVIKRICLRKFKWEKPLRKLLDQGDVSQKKKLEKNNFMKKENLMKKFSEENVVKKVLLKKCNKSFGLKKFLGPKNLWLKTILVKKRKGKKPFQKDFCF